MIKTCPYCGGYLPIKEAICYKCIKKALASPEVKRCSVTKQYRVVHPKTKNATQ